MTRWKWLVIKTHTVTLQPNRLVALPRKSRTAIRSSSEKKTGRRSLPRDVTWYTAPGNSIRSGRAIVPRGSLGLVQTPRNLLHVEPLHGRTPRNGRFVYFRLQSEERP